MSTYGYLAHHGINGQKWGVRNGPPYPLKPGMHSAAERKKNNNRYSQGVKQNRGGSSSKSGSSYSGSRERTKEEELALLEKREKAKKIMKGVAIGAGVTAATAAIATLAVGGAATYAGIKTMKKNPETTKAILSNIGSSLVSGLKSQRELSEGMKDINKIKDTNDRKFATDMLKNSIKANRADDKQARADKLWAAKFLDRTSKGNDKREYYKLATDVTTKFGRDQMIKDPRLMRGQEEKIFNMTPVKEYQNGKPVYYKEGELLNEMVTKSKGLQRARNTASAAQRDYNSTHGVKGTFNKVTGGIKKIKEVADTIDGTKSNVKSIIGTAGGLATAAGIGKALSNNSRGGGYDDYYYDQYGNKRKKNPNQQYNNQQRRY